MDPRAPGSRWGWALGALGTLAVLALLALALDLGPFKKPELTRGDLIARGDEICRKAHDAFADLQQRPPRTAREAAELTASLVEIAEQELDEIGTLDGPPEFEARIAAYLAAREEAIATMRAGIDAAAGRETGAYARLQAEVADTQRRRRELARRIGFAVCSRPLQAG